MLLHEKIKLLFSAMKLKGNVLSHYASVDTTTISRIKTGKLIPKQTSVTIQKLIDGMVLYAKEQDSLQDIIQILGEDGIAANESNLEACLAAWLYQDVEFPERTISEGRRPAPAYAGYTFSIAPFFHFGHKLDQLMQFTGLSNPRLGRMSNLAPSYISRLRNGRRSPKSNPGIVFRICEAVINEAITQGKEAALADLVGAPTEAAENKDWLYVHLSGWLCDQELEQDMLPIRQMLKSLDSFSKEHADELPPLSKIMEESAAISPSAYYTGDEGLQKAVVRFLCAAIKNGNAKELFLYSDQDMDWMVTPADFRMKWMSLMLECVRKGIHIKIIHNIKRNIAEMVDAIKAWLPLYMSGMVEPYYCTLEVGTRFSTTMFFCPDTACIEAVFPTGCHADACYNYHTEPEILGSYRNIFRSLLTHSKFLVRMELGRQPTDFGHNAYTDTENNICIMLRKVSVIVSKTTPPYISFVFLHPLMYEAFRAFLEQDKS